MPEAQIAETGCLEHGARKDNCEDCWRAALARPFTREEWDRLNRMANEDARRNCRDRGPLFAVPKASPKPRIRKTADILADIRKTLTPDENDRRKCARVIGAAAGGWTLTATDGSAALLEHTPRAKGTEDASPARMIAGWCRVMTGPRVDLTSAFDVALKRAAVAVKHSRRPYVTLTYRGDDDAGELVIETRAHEWSTGDNISTRETIDVMGAGLAALVPVAYNVRYLTMLCGQWPLHWYPGVDAGSPAVLTASPDWRVIVMPVRL